MDAKILSFPELVKEVGEWSQANFGDQDGLNEVAPILGVSEEILFELRRATTIEDTRDAFADAIIFLADAFYRLEFSGAGLSWEDRSHQGELRFSIGATHRAVLKYRQGIRGKTAVDVLGELGNLFKVLVASYYHVAGEGTTGIGQLVTDTWAEVKQRDWKKNPADAHKVAAEVAQ